MLRNLLLRVTLLLRYLYMNIEVWSSCTAFCPKLVPLRATLADEAHEDGLDRDGGQVGQRVLVHGGHVAHILWEIE